MLFLNPWLLAGLLAVSIPIIIHLIRRQAAKPMDWGAMRFLFDTISVRRRKMEWEDLLLMAARCLLLCLIALAVARPFLTPDSRVPWMFVLPAALLGIALLGASFVLSSRKMQWMTRGTAILLLLLALALGFWEKVLNLRRFEASGRRDVALIIDASASMEMLRGGKSVFQNAIEEARKTVIEAPQGTAFVVVLGGPAPEAKTASPLTHRADVLGVLDSLKPVGGSFRAHDALSVATLALAQGNNASKDIIVFTDAQRSGWRLEDPGAWNGLEQAWKSLPTKPKLMVRNFGEPETFVNLAVTSCTSSRAVVGTDREVALKVELANTGKSIITPGPVTLVIDEKKIGSTPVGLLSPGQKTTVEFRHHFTTPGAHVVRATVDAKDDLAADNRTEMVMTIRDKLPVLLIDGNASGTFFERACGYTALALAPTSSLMTGKAAGEKFLMDPRVVSAATLKIADLDQAKVIVLADVPRLPELLATRLAEKVAAGTGLIIIAGPRCEAPFYNQWSGFDGSLMPMPLAEEQVDAAGINPAPATFVHEALALFTKRSDLGDAVVRRWRKVGAPLEQSVQAAAFSNGETFLASRSYGNGRIILSTCAFDARSGNLPARRAFVPLMHELVSWVAGGGLNWNVDAMWSPSVALNQGGGGLAAHYFRTKGKRGKKDKKDPQTIDRIDSAIDFDWSDRESAPGMPRDNFSVLWRATLIPPMTGEYQFEAEVNERLTMSVADKETWKVEGDKKALGSMRLQAGKSEEVELYYEQDGGPAFVRLYWTIPGGKRQLIPSASWIPLIDEAEPMRVIDPLGLPRQASIQVGRRGQELKVAGPAVPGIYQIVADEKLAEVVGVKPATSLPLAVRRDAEESTFAPMNENDLTLMRKHADLMLPQSVGDLLSILHGKGFGREIALWLAIAAAAFLLLESVLARWVSRSRRAAEDVRVSFGEDTVWRGGLR